ncbi:MAG: hypothetical protein JO168_15605 [Solirubrobacterales bacterium]|nr:hypothetical protein [Solirubrobacterales bacterium]
MSAEQEWLAERFEGHRAQLRAVAYRMLGSVSEADDLVEGLAARLSREDQTSSESMRAWWMTFVAGLCLSTSGARKPRCQTAFTIRVRDRGFDRKNWVEPEPTELIADSVGLALLAAVGTLSPSERLAFVLQNVFAMPLDRIGEILECSPKAAAGLLASSRARMRHHPRVSADGQDES